MLKMLPYKTAIWDWDWEWIEHRIEQNGKNVCYLLINDTTCVSEIVMLTWTSQNKNATNIFTQ